MFPFSSVASRGTRRPSWVVPTHCDSPRENQRLRWTGKYIVQRISVAENHALFPIFPIFLFFFSFFFSFPFFLFPFCPLLLSRSSQRAYQCGNYHRSMYGKSGARGHSRRWTVGHVVALPFTWLWLTQTQTSDGSGKWVATTKHHGTMPTQPSKGWEMAVGDQLEPFEEQGTNQARSRA